MWSPPAPSRAAKADGVIAEAQAGDPLLRHQRIPEGQGLPLALFIRASRRWETLDQLNGGIDRITPHYSARWHHETLGNVTQDDVYYGRREFMPARRAKMKEETLSRRTPINNQPQGPDGDEPCLNSDPGNCHPA